MFEAKKNSFEKLLYRFKFENKTRLTDWIAKKEKY